MCFMKALQHSSEDAEAMGKASSHLLVLQKVVNKYFIPSLSGNGPTTSKWIAENLWSGTSKNPDPGLTVLDCFAS